MEVGSSDNNGGTRNYDSSEIDQLLRQFSCLGSTDKEVLISQLQKVLNNQISPAACGFFLDMNNWNLQAAVCSYFDLGEPKWNIPSMTLIRDITVGDGLSVQPSTSFTKTWTIQNSGDEAWPHGCYLGGPDGVRVPVKALEPSETTEVSVQLTSPAHPGTYETQWRTKTSTGIPFGETIWMIVTVEEFGLMGVTQQMDALRTANGMIAEAAPLSGLPTHAPHFTTSPASGDMVLPSPPGFLPGGNPSVDEDDNMTS